MRLSEIKGEAALDCIEAIVGPAARLVSDKELRDLFKGTDVAAKAESIASFVLSKHRNDAVEILAALSMQTPEDYIADTTLPKLLGDVYCVLTDEELLGFLTHQQAASGTTSGATLEG